MTATVLLEVPFSARGDRIPDAVAELPQTPKSSVPHAIQMNRTLTASDVNDAIVGPPAASPQVPHRVRFCEPGGSRRQFSPRNP